MQIFEHSSGINMNKLWKKKKDKYSDDFLLTKFFHNLLNI